MAMNRVIVLSTIGAQAGTGGCLVQGGGSQDQSFVALRLLNVYIAQWCAMEDISQISTQKNIN